MIWYILGGIVLLLIFFGVVGGLHARRSSPQFARAKFLARRPDLEREFFERAASAGKPRGLRWVRCNWGEGVEFVREKETGQLAALVETTIQFEAVEGGAMEGLPAVGNLRTASAVFFYHHGDWHTTGKALFNLLPADAVARFQNHYEKQEI
jgi:hypothetical protein